MQLTNDYKITQQQLEQIKNPSNTILAMQNTMAEYFTVLERLKQASNDTIKKCIYNSCWLCDNNRVNFISDYFKSSKLCRQLFEQPISSVNYFRDNIVEIISNDFIQWLKSPKCNYVFKNSFEENHIKNQVIGLLGELFNLYYLTNISAYRTENGMLKRFKKVVPFKTFMQQQDFGIDLICIDEHDDICIIQVKFYSTWSSKQHKIELKEHCSNIFNEAVRHFYCKQEDCKEHVFFMFLGNKEHDISLTLKNSPYFQYLSFFDEKNYFNDTEGNTTLYKDFWNFLNEL